MTAPALARLTSLVVVAGAGLALGHLLNPLTAGGTHPGPLTAFVLGMGAIGAWRGWRHVAVRAEWNGHAMTHAAGVRGAVVGAGAALVVAALAYTVVHGAGLPGERGS
jgi:hypothetical protein